MTNGRKKNSFICGYDMFLFEHILVTETLLTIHSLKISFILRSVSVQFAVIKCSIFQRSLAQE